MHEAQDPGKQSWHSSSKNTAPVHSPVQEVLNHVHDRVDTTLPSIFKDRQLTRS